MGKGEKMSTIDELRSPVRGEPVAPSRFWVAAVPPRVPSRGICQGGVPWRARWPSRSNGQTDVAVDSGIAESPSSE